MKTVEEYTRSIIAYNARMYQLAERSIEEGCYIDCYVPDVIPEVIPLVEDYKKTKSLDKLYEYFMSHRDIITIYDIYYLLIYDGSKDNNFDDTDIYNGQWFEDFKKEVEGFYDLIKQRDYMAQAVFDREKLTINKLLCSFIVSFDEYNKSFMDVIRNLIKLEHDIMSGMYYVPQTTISSVFQLCLMAEFERFMEKMCRYIERVNEPSSENECAKVG